jgi:hypothetical protein
MQTSNWQNSNQTVPFTEQDVKAYLVACVLKWRARRDHPEDPKAAPEVLSQDNLMAICYIDAFQSVHTSLFGTLVP